MRVPGLPQRLAGNPALAPASGFRSLDFREINCLPSEIDTDEPGSAARVSQLNVEAALVSDPPSGLAWIHGSSPRMAKRHRVW